MKKTLLYHLTSLNYEIHIIVSFTIFILTLVVIHFLLCLYNIN